MFETVIFYDNESLYSFLDNLRNVDKMKIYKVIRFLGTTEFCVEWLICSYIDTQYAPFFQIYISSSGLRERQFIAQEYDESGESVQGEAWTDWTTFAKSKDLHMVALSGEFSDLKNTPTVDQSYNSNSENAQSGKAVAEAIAKLINGSPESLDTLQELANALGNDENFAATVLSKISEKASTQDLASGNLVVSRAINANSAEYSHRAICDMNDQQIDATYAKKSEIPTVDIELNTESTNAIQNKAVAEAIARIEYLKEITYEEIDTALISGIYIIDNGKQYLLVSDCRPDDYIYQTLIYGTTISMRVYHHNTWEPWMYLADKYYVDMMGQEIEATIGNIETSLENIITKYGLGGDSE